tara:strand:- start:2907 stop:3914 length:1008 start_codon:yes stop_codon:yes gene_type:complete
MNTPLISIIIPSYNRADLINETLQSVVEQTSPNWQCLVVDDGSNDGTQGTISAFAKADPRIKFLQRTEDYASGGNGARQMGLDHIQTPWVMFLDSDDVLDRSCIKNRLLEIDESLDMLVFHTATFKQQVGDHPIYWNLLKEGETNTDYIRRFIHQDMPWHTTGVLWSTSFLQKIGGWNQELTAWQDWELHLRALSFQPKIKAHKATADNYYRLDVKDSIASKKQSLAYSRAVCSAMHAVELKVLETLPSIEKDFRYLVYRNLIGNPIQWKRTDVSKQIIALGIPFNTVTKQRFVFAFWRARFYEITTVKRLLKHLLKISYYRRLYPRTTFLKQQF